MEVRGSNPRTTGGSLHGPGYSGMHPLSKSFSLPEGGPVLSDDFHIYAIEWEVGVVRFYVDDTLFETRTPADIPADAGGPSHWVYNHPFFILINVGIGGTPPWGPPTGTTFPQTMDPPRRGSFDRTGPGTRRKCGRYRPRGRVDHQ
jgi:beta-glucanase (GH16 family)